MKTATFLTGAALLFAGSAVAAEVQVVADPDTNVTVRHVEYTPAMHPANAGLVTADGEGMLSADEVGEVDAGFGPGFEADAVIYVWSDGRSDVRMVSPVE